MAKFRFKLPDPGFSVFERRAIWFLVLILLIGVALRYYQKSNTTRQLKLETATISDTLKDSSSKVMGVITPENPLDINSATVQELQLLPEIGPKKAERIVAYREVNGLFKDIDSLINVYGIGPKTVEKLKPLICLKVDNQVMLRKRDVEDHNEESDYKK